MATRRHRRVSHIGPDMTKMATRQNQRWNQSHIISPDVSVMATKRNQRESHNCPNGSNRIVMFDSSTSNERAKISRKGNKHVPKAARYFPCHLLRNAHHSTVKILRIIRVRMARAFCCISRKGSGRDDRDPAHQKFAPARDSHQSDAVEDCIAFMNSSSRKYE